MTLAVRYPVQCLRFMSWLVRLFVASVVVTAQIVRWYHTMCNPFSQIYRDYSGVLEILQRAMCA
jgi:cellobiose-specific phosphotransferase system component IIC